MTLAAHLLEVIFLGFLMGLVPGPVVTSLFTETIRKGWHAARRIVVWAAAGELVMSVTCVAALSTLIGPASPVLAALSVFGALVLLSLARDLWKVEEIDKERPQRRDQKPAGTLFSNRRIFTIAVLNGMAWVFWITVCTPQALALEGEIRFGRWLFIALFEAGWCVSTLLLCSLFGLFRPYFQSNRKLHLLYRTVSLLFVLFAVKLAVGSVRSLLH